MSLQIHLMGPRPGANLPRVLGDLDAEAVVATAQSLLDKGLVKT